MTPALRWAAMRVVLCSVINCEGQSHKTVSTNHNPFEEKGEPKRYRTEVLLPNALPETKPAHQYSISLSPSFISATACAHSEPPHLMLLRPHWH